MVRLSQAEEGRSVAVPRLPESVRPSCVELASPGGGQVATGKHLPEVDEGTLGLGRDFGRTLEADYPPVGMVGRLPNP